MDKIPIKKISKRVYVEKGFPPLDSCLNCKCGKNGKGGACCDKGVYVDKESYELIKQHRDYFEKKFNRKFDDFFDPEWSADTEYLGKKCIGTRAENGYCVFRLNGCCELISFVLANKLPMRMIPSACRIYPLSWDKGKLFVSYIRKGCVCRTSNSDKSLFESHKEDLDDIFEFK